MAGNIVIANLRSPNSNQDTFYGVWNLSRAMKSAGWVYKASADGTNSDLNTGNAILDKWGPGVLVQSTQLSSQTGAAAVVGASTADIVTVTGLTGMTANSVGHGLLISGAVNAANNGTFTIVAFVSAASVKIWNPNGISEATSLTWSERVSGTGASVATPVGDEATLTGLSGLSTSTSPGHLITITNATNGANNGTFRISSVISSTSCKIKNSSAIAESGTLIWVENTPIGDIYPFTQFSGTSGWINMQGPSTMKLPISAASTGNLVRGENVTQTSSGAQGELIGYLWDVPTNQGYLVVAPRINGTGGGPRGWTTGTADTITGGISGATVPTFSTPVEFVREMVFWKTTNTTQGLAYYQCIDQNLESAQRFSFLASTAAGVTASVAPGGGGTSNTFPTNGTIMCIGATTSSATDWDMNSSPPSVYGRIQIIAANNASTTNVSQDGTFFMIVGRPDVNSNFCTGFTFCRVDNSEDGDVDPYVWYQGNGGNGANYGGSRTSCTNNSNTDGWSFIGSNQTTSTQARGWRKRGFGTNQALGTNGDNFQQFSIGGVTTYLANNNNSIFAMNYNTQDNDSIACAFSPTKVREPIFVVSSQLGSKMRKGTMRWMYSVAGGNAMDTFDSFLWIQVSGNTGGNVGTGPFVVGPWNGTTVPVQS